MNMIFNERAEDSTRRGAPRPYIGLLNRWFFLKTDETF